MRHRRSFAFTALLVFTCTSIAWAQKEPSITTFDAPGAGTSPGQGTIALAINLQGEITGYYTDGGNLAHGFVRSPDGKILAINAPGATQGTFPAAINFAGKITGYYIDDNSVAHGFVRRFDGSVVPFDADGAGTGQFEGTFPNDIGVDGSIVGYYLDASLGMHGFLRNPDGTLVTLDDPSAGTGAFLGTFATAIDPEGTIVGCYLDSSVLGWTFQRSRSGAYTTLTPPGGIGGYVGCGSTVFSVLPFNTTAINPVGVIAGTYFEPVADNLFGGNYRGFARVFKFESFWQPPSVDYITFDAVPSPSSPCCTWTFPVAINLAGQVVGYDNDFNGEDHGFLRDPQGEIEVFDVPGAQGTVATSVNLFGVIAGYYGSGGVSHGFVRIP